MKKITKKKRMNRSISKWLVGCVAFLFTEACAHPVQQPQEELQTLLPVAEQPTSQSSEEEKPAVEAVTNAAPAVRPQDSVAQLKAWDAQLQFLKTSFVQTTTYDGLLVSRSQGTLFYDQKKHRLRLDTQDADGAVVQSAVTDKKKIFILDNTGKEVAQLSWEQWQQGQPNQALFDFGNYTALLNRHEVKTVRPGLLMLTPKEGEKYTLYVTLRKEDAFPQRLKLVSGDMVTQADLTQIQQNKPLPATTFGGFFK